MALDGRTHRIYTVTSAFGPAPAPTSSEPHPRPSLVPGTFSLLVLEPLIQLERWNTDPCRQSGTGCLRVT